MLHTRISTGFLLRGLLLFGLGFQLGLTQIHTRSFCTEITMPDTRLCEDNLPIIEIVDVYQYDFAGDEYVGRPCVYSDSDCGRAIRPDNQLYRDILTHCDGQRTCGGFYITGISICSGRKPDYMTISFKCHRDETATTVRIPSTTTQEADTDPFTLTTTPTRATTTASPVNRPNTTPSSATTTGSPVNPPSSSGVTDGESNENEKVNIGLYASVVGGGFVAVILVIVVIAVCVKRKKRHTESKQTDTDDGDTPAANQTPGEQQSSGLQTPGEKEVVLEEIVTDNDANESSPEQPDPDRMAAANSAVSQHDPDLAMKDSPVGNNPGQGDSTLLATPTADTQEDWGYSSVGAATSAPTPSSKEPKYDQHNTNTVPATTQQPVDTNHTTGPDVYATVQKDKPRTRDIQNKASDDDKEPDVYATVQKDRGEDADELVMKDNPLCA